MTAAIFGLLGVVVGGVLNGVVSYWLDYRREGHAVKAAARLLADELAYARANIRAAHESGHNYPLTLTEWTFVSWAENRALLAGARRMDAEGWFAISHAVRDSISVGKYVGTSESVLRDAEIERLRSADDAAGTALDLLGVLARGEHLRLSRRARETAHSS